MLRTYRYRIYPNKTQAARLGYMLSIGRAIYNDAIAQRRWRWERSRLSISLYDLRDYYTALRREHPDDIPLPGKTVEALIRRVDKAYKAFFCKLKRGEKVSYPKFKGRRHFRSLDFVGGGNVVKHTNCSGQMREYHRPGDKPRLYLAGVGEIEIVYHRPLPVGARIKNIVVTEDRNGKWFASLQCEFEARPLRHDMCDGAIGVDIGFAALLALSNGELVDFPHWYIEAQAERRRIQRKLDRQRRANNPQHYNDDGTIKPGVRRWHYSRGMETTERKLRNLENRVREQRRYFWNVITDHLTRSYSYIAIEDLTLDFLLKNKQLGKHARDASFSTFWNMLEYKAEERGCHIVRVPPAYTSQTCSACGHVHKDNRKTQAGFRCVSCGYEENADVNAARNILNTAINGGVQPPHGETQAVGSNVP